MPSKKLNEATVQAIVRERFSATTGGLLWRNNVGACKDERGNFFRYGLANDSAKMNEILKSADLIGIRPVVVTQDMVGKTIGQFVSREVKATDWKYKGTKREKAQLNWIKLVEQLGGDASFTNGSEYNEET